jgi:hypothetical protein
MEAGGFSDTCFYNILTDKQLRRNLKNRNNFVLLYSFICFCLVLYFFATGGHKMDTAHAFLFWILVLAGPMLPRHTLRQYV